jgi:cell division protein FtsI (penicillin-binding protein 3)
MLLAQKDADVDGAADEDSGDLRALFDQVNSLPVDDPLRQPANAAAMAANAQADAASEAAMAAKQSQPARGWTGLPEKVLAAFHANGDTTSVMPDASASVAKVSALVVVPVIQTKNNGVVVDGGRRVAVPSFAGAPLRNVVEMADGAGLRVQTVGSGLAREQAPVAGTMVPMGTEVVVRFAR